jgi:hypothetical protein
MPRLAGPLPGNFYRLVGAVFAHLGGDLDSLDPAAQATVIATGWLGNSLFLAVVALISWRAFRTLFRWRTGL